MPRKAGALSDSDSPNRLSHRDAPFAGALLALLSLAVIGSVLAIGAVHTPVLIALAVVVTTSTGVALRRRRTRWPLPAWILLGLAAYSVFQALPLPAALTGALAPKNAEVWARALAPLGEAGPHWVSLSVDPGASLVEALKWLTYSFGFVSAAAVATKVGAAPGIALVFVSALLAALTTIGHGLLGAERVFGIYRPTFQPSPWHLGPLLDPNNLSGYLNLGALCGLGLVLSHRVSVPRWLIGIGVALVIAVNVVTASRAGFVALLVGVLVLGVILLRARRRVVNERWDRALAGRGIVAAALGGGTLLAVLGANSATWNDLVQTDLEKLTFPRYVLPMIRDHLWFGVGRGAFETAFSAYHVPKLNLLFTHAENFVVDWAAGWGVPVTVGALVGLSWSLRPSALRIAHAPIAAAGFAAVVALAVQNLGDLGLEVPAVALAAAVVLGTLWGQAHRDRERAERSDSKRHPRAGWRPWLVASAALVVLGACAKWGMRSALDDRGRLYQRWSAGVNGPGELATFRSELRAAMLRHPAEPYFPYLGAIAAYRGRDQNALAWVARTLELDGGRGRTHFLLAEILASRGAMAQALLQLRLAVSADRNFHSVAAERAVRWTSDCDRLVQSAPEGTSGWEMLGVMGSGMMEKDGACAERLLRDAMGRAPQAAPPRAELARLIIRRLRAPSGEPACAGGARAKCLSEAEHLATEVTRLSPRASESLRLRAELLLVEGKADEAAKLLSNGCAEVDDRVTCFGARLDAAAATKRSEELTAAAKDFLAVSCAAAEECASAHLRVGDLFVGQGELATARTHYERAAREAHNEEAWLKVADAASRAGAHRQAADALAKVAKLRGGGDAELRARIENEQQRAMGAQ